MSTENYGPLSKTNSSDVINMVWAETSLTEAEPHLASSYERQSLVRQGVARNGSVIVKYTLEQPLNPIDSVPIVLVPGYGGIKPAYSQLRKAVVASGKTAVTFKPPRTQERLAALRPKHALHPDRLLAQATIGIARDIIRRYGEEEGFAKVDAAGHSMGGPGVTNAALARPQWFRSVVLMGSAGLDGHSLKDIAVRAPDVLRQEILPSIQDIKMRKDLSAAWDFLHYMARNPLRTLAEGLIVGSGDIRDKVSMVGRSGVKTAAIPFAQDRFFPLDGVIKGSADRFNQFSVYPDEAAGHMTPQLQPEQLGAFLVQVVQQLNTAPSIAA